MVSASSPPQPLTALPKPLRPKHGSFWHAAAFIFLFNTGIIITNLFQLILYPLNLVPPTRSYYSLVITFTKGSFGKLCVLITQRFAPTTFVITAGEGVAGQAGTEEWVTRDASGSVVGLKLPAKAVWISNHQTLCDWLYLWTFAYVSGHHRSILITLKSSLRHIPFIGWACQLYGFIFLARNWTLDQGPFRRKLQQVGDEINAEGGNDRLALMLFPEGTLVTGNTRLKSAAFAQKLGVDDLKYTLLPRSTGLFFALRTLAPQVPDLTLLDLTVGYPHVAEPPTSYPEDHYDLSLWTKNVPPPTLHFHLRAFKLAQIPLGDYKVGGEATEQEKLAFDGWLRERWQEKDELMAAFYRDGEFFKGQDKGRKVEWRVELRSWWENAEAFGFGMPVVVLWWAVPLFWSILTVLGGWLLGRGAGQHSPELSKRAVESLGLASQAAGEL